MLIASSSPIRAAPASRSGRTQSLIAQHPWTGVGWGRFNFAWTFTPFPDRPRAFFDHTHNLPLQGAVEMDVPAMLGVLGLLLAALWLARSAWSNDERDDAGHPVSAARPALVMLAVPREPHRPDASLFRHYTEPARVSPL